MGRTESGSGHEGVLRHLLRHTMDRSKGGLEASLSDPKVLRSIAATYFVLDADPRGNVEWFLNEGLQRLIQQLSRSMKRSQGEYHGQVRGRVIWPATLKARYGQDYDPMRYVCREARRQYDTPENQLVIYLVERITACLLGVPDVIRQGVCYYPASNKSDTVNTSARVGQMEISIHNFQRHACYQQITSPSSIEPSHLDRAERASVMEYSVAAYLYRRYESIVESPARDELVAIGERVLPLPGYRSLEGDTWIYLAAQILGRS